MHFGVWTIILELARRDGRAWLQISVPTEVSDLWYIAINEFFISFHEYGFRKFTEGVP